MAKSTEVKPTVDISIKDILGMLDNGLDRRAIAKHYGVTLATMKTVFQHPKLKSKRVKPRTPVNIIDDVEDTVVAETPAAQTVSAAPASAETAANTGQPEAAANTATGNAAGNW